MTETILHKILLWEVTGDIPMTYDNWNMSGVVKPSKSSAGRGKPIYEYTPRVILYPNNWFEDVLLRAFAKALVFAANAGQHRLRSVNNEHVDRFLTTSLPPIESRTLIMHPEEIEAQKGYLKGQCLPLKYLPKRSIIAVGPPDSTGMMVVDSKGPHPLRLDFFINPMYVTGCRRTGKVT